MASQCGDLGFGPSCSLMTHNIIIWFGLGVCWPQCRCLVWFREFVEFVGICGPQCRCLVWFREFVGTCGLCSEGAVLCMAQGLKV